MRRVRQCAVFTCHSGGIGLSAKVDVWPSLSMFGRVFRQRRAICDLPGIVITVLLLALCGPAQVSLGQTRDVELDEAIGVRFTLADGVEVRGELKTWNQQSFDGSFGRRKWTELRHDDLWRVFRQVMNQEEAEHWISLGLNLLLISKREPKAEPYAERAFEHALDADATAEQAVAEAREKAAEAHRVAEQLRKAIAEARLQTTSPEAAQWPTDQWPILNAQAQEDALAQAMQRAEDILSRAGARIRPFESEHFLLYSKLDPAESIEWIRKLEALYRHMGRQLGFDETGNVFRGKAVVFIWQDRDRYRLVEADAFRQLVSLDQTAMTHYADGFVFVNTCHEPYQPEFGSALLTHAALGILHRYVSARRLPAWANHGYAALAAMQVLDKSWNEYELRNRGLLFIREGGNLNAALSIDYDNEQWPGPKMVITAVGMLTIELMQREQPRRFAQWIRAIKQGDDWETSLREQFATDRRILVATTAQYYTVND